MADHQENQTNEGDADAGEHHGHEKASYDDVNTTAIVVVGLISALFTFLTVAFVQGLYYQWNNSYVRERSTDYVNLPVKRIVDEQKAELEGNAEAGTKSIEDAMKIFLDKYETDDEDESSEPAESGPAHAAGH